MKKLFCTLWMAAFLLSMNAAAWADLVLPGHEYVRQRYSESVWPYVLLGVAVIATALLIRRMRRK